MERYEREENDNKVSIWVPILMIPLLLVAGWAANDAFESASGTNTQFGVGGSPGTDVVTPVPTSPFDQTPGDQFMPEETTPTPTEIMMDDSVSPTGTTGSTL